MKTKDHSQRMFTCANPSSGSHIRPLLKTESAANTHHRKWGCSIYEIRVFVTGSKHAVGEPIIAMNPAVTRDVL